MSEPFVFHFQLGEGQRPEVMYIADILAECGLCRHQEIQRFYHTTPFHELTLDRFAALSLQTRDKTDYSCENCGTPVGPAHALKTATTLGFADESGVLTAYHDVREGTACYRGVAPQRLDPQVLPVFDANDALGDQTDALTDDWFERVFGRVFNAKRAWIDLFHEVEDDQSGWSVFSPGMVAIIESSWEAIEDAADEIESIDALSAGEFELVDLRAAPDALATHADPSSMYGGLSHWLPSQLLGELDQGQCVAAALVSWDQARSLIERTFKVGLLRFEVEETGDDVWYRNITTPGDITYDHDVSVLSVLQRAVYTGITPGEAARLTAEEITGRLLRVF